MREDLSKWSMIDVNTMKKYLTQIINLPEDKFTNEKQRRTIVPFLKEGIFNLEKSYEKYKEIWFNNTVSNKENGQEMGNKKTQTQMDS